MRVNLKGKYRIGDTSGTNVPYYLFLPKPSHVRSDFKNVKYYSIIRKGEFIHWDVTWVGEKKCNEVLNSVLNLKQEMVFVRSIYKKFQKEGRTDDDLRYLMEYTSKRISFWNRIIAKIRKQMK